eukprot:1076223-Rhodomonas_salina.5
MPVVPPSSSLEGDTKSEREGRLRQVCCSDRLLGPRIRLTCGLAAMPPIGHPVPDDTPPMGDVRC